MHHQYNYVEVISVKIIHPGDLNSWYDQNIQYLFLIAIECLILYNGQAVPGVTMAICRLLEDLQCMAQEEASMSWSWTHSNLIGERLLGPGTSGACQLTDPERLLKMCDCFRCNSISGWFPPQGYVFRFVSNLLMVATFVYAKFFLKCNQTSVEKIYIYINKLYVIFFICRVYPAAACRWKRRRCRLWYRSGSRCSRRWRERRSPVKSESLTWTDTPLERDTCCLPAQLLGGWKHFSRPDYRCFLLRGFFLSETVCNVNF